MGGGTTYNAERADAGSTEATVAISFHERTGYNSFRTLYEENRNRVTNIVAHYLNNRADVDDVVSDTFLKAFKNIPHFKPGWNMRPWLDTIAVRTSIDYIRKNKRMIPHDPNSRMFIRGSVKNLETRIGQGLDVERAFTLISNVLRPALRRAIKLYGLGLTYKEMAKETGEKEGTLQSKVSLAKKQLQPYAPQFI